MAEAKHRTPEPPPSRRRGVRIRRRKGRRRTTVDPQPLTRAELKEASAKRARGAARRRIGIAMLVSLLIIWAAVVAAWWFDNRPAEDDATPPTVDVPDTGVSALVGITTDDDTLGALALFSASDDEGTSLILFHPSLLTTLPGYGEHVLANAYRFGGEDLIATTARNLLGVRVDGIVTMSTADLAGLVAEPLVVDLPVELVVADGTSQVVVAGTGPVGRDGQAIARLMTDAGLGTELDLLQRQGAAWAALLALAADDEVFAEALGGGAPGAVRDAIAAVATGDPIVTIVPATRIEPSGNEERYQLDGADVGPFVDQHMSFLQLEDEPRVRVEVLNGNGRIGTTQPVAAQLARAGFRVVLTDNADSSDHTTTLIIAQGTEYQQAALDLRALIGLGDVSVEIHQPSGVVDVTIIVGADLPAGG